MVRFSTLLNRFRRLSALTAAALCLVPALSARAGSYVYGSRLRTVNAGVLIAGTAASAAPDSAPYVFYVLNRRSDIKPFGWNIVNPRAPSSVSAATATRWPAYNAGQSVTTNMAAYWEVPLSDTSADQLRQYDVLYLPLGGIFKPSDVEKLRRFVDSGGQLWIEATGAATGPNYSGSAAFPDVSFSAGAAAAPLPPSVAGPLYLRQPILSQPFLLSYDDLFTLGTVVPAGNQVTGGTEFANLFGSALVCGSGPAVSVAQYGAGQVIASALNIGGVINAPVGAGAYCGGTTGTAIPNFAAAPAQDLRFLSNLIAGSGVHSSENKNGHQNAASNDLASFSPAWSAATSGSTIPPGAAVWGNYVFVTGADGILHAFDAYPAESLTGTASADDGLADFSSASPTAYDQVWNATVGANASGPTVASYNGIPYVFVEKADGSILQFSALTGSGGTPMTPPTAVTHGPTSYSGSNAPAPTFFEGRIFAGEPNSDLFVYKLPSGPGYRAPVNPGAATGSTEGVIGSPAVGLLSGGTLTNNIVAYVPTSQNLYTVFLGARADQVQPNVTPPGTPTGYTVNRGRLRIPNLKVDASSTPAPRLYQFDGTAVGTSSPYVADFGTVSGVTGAVYADYDTDLVNSYYSSPGVSNGGTLNLNEISDFSAGGVNNTQVSAGVSAPAIDRAGNLYYTVNAPGESYLFGVHQDPQFQNVQIKFRFRLPTSSDARDFAVDSITDWSYLDADGVNYTPLTGYQFVGAPVVDDQGFVYVAAVNGNSAAVLCFNTSQAVYADFNAAFSPSQASYTQADEFNPLAPNTLRPGPIDATLKYGQFTALNGRVTFFNFGIGVFNGGFGGNRQIAGNLCEPQPVTAVPYNNTNDPNQQTFQPVTLPLHTNLSWFTIFGVNGGISGLAKVGDTLFLSDGGTNALPSLLYSINARGGSDGTQFVLNSPKQVASGGQNSAKRKMVAPYATLNLGATTATPSVGNGVLVVNGANGVSTLTQQFTLIADNNRILETDSSGQAVWAVDSTNSGSAVVDFNHPVSLSQVTANDYLVADTGNNRCVRFDRAGDVLWELTKFDDPNTLLVAGQPTTLSQPTSVEIRRYIDATDATLTDVSYLIADSGNYRVLEVTDQFKTATGAPFRSHVLTWASHTHDKQGRSYRYSGAAYFPVSNGLLIAAIVTNTRLAPLDAGGLGPSSNDAPGGSVVLFDYATSQMAYVFTSFMVPDAAGNPTTPIAIRNPRSLSVYQPPSGSVNVPSFLYTNDNGAFDLVYDSVHKLIATGTYNGTMYIQPTLHFTQGQYQLMNSPTVGLAAAPSRAALPFVPSCVQRLNNDPLNPKYLITQTYSQAELGNTARLGGEVFEVDGNSPMGGFSGSTLSRPGLTGPLTQPTFAIRPQQ